MTDGGMQKYALEHLKELQRVDEKVGEWLSETFEDEFNVVADLYTSEYSTPEATNEIDLGGWEIKEPEYIELLILIINGRVAAGDDPPTMGIRNRLLIQLIMANPEAYTRVRQRLEDETERAAREREKAGNRERHRSRTADRHEGLHNGTDIPIGEDDEDV